MANAGLGFAFVFFVSRDLGARGTGAFYECVALLTIVMLASQGGAPNAIIRSIASQRAVRNEEAMRPSLVVAAIPPVLISFLAATALFFLAGRWAGLLLHDRAMQHVFARDLRVFAFGVPLGTAAGVVFGATQGFGRMAPAAVIDNIARPALRALLAAVVFPFDHSGVAASIVWVAPMFMSLILGVISLHHILGTRCDRETRRRWLPTVGEARSFWAFALPQSFSSLLQVALVWLDVVLLGVLRGSKDAGVYATASRYLLFGTLVLGAVATAISPQIAAFLAASDLARARRIFRVGTLWVTAISVPLYLLMAIFARPLMGYFGEQFLPGAAALTLLSIAMLANIVTGPAGMVVLMGGRSRYLLAATTAAFATNLGLDLLLIPPLGLIGAASAWAASIAAFNMLVSWKAIRCWRIHPFNSFLLRLGVVACLLFGGGGLIVVHLANSTAGLFGAAAPATVLYIAIAWRFRRHAAALSRDSPPALG